MRVPKIIAALVVALLAIYLAAAPYITVYQIKSAAKAHDGVALSQHIDFASVRQSLKDQMNAKFMRELGQNSAGLGEPFAVLGLALAGVVVDKAVDVYVTPAGVTQLMQGHKPQPSEDNAPASSGVTFENKFTVALRSICPSEYLLSSISKPSRPF